MKDCQGNKRNHGGATAFSSLPTCLAEKSQGKTKSMTSHPDHRLFGKLDAKCFNLSYVQ